MYQYTRFNVSINTYFWLVQTKPVLQSGSTIHSGLHPVIVSGLGISPGSHLGSKIQVIGSFRYRAAVLPRPDVINKF